MMEDLKTLLFPNPYDLQNTDGDSRYVFLVEHARNTIPASLNNLGVSDEDMQKHIAWDIGIEEVTRTLSDHLNAPAIYGMYSRLLAEINRDADHPDVFRSEYDGIYIPGNVDLSVQDKQQRMDEIYKPYYAAATQMITDHCNKVGKDEVIGVAMHSCTRQLQGQPERPWHIGLSTYNSDSMMHDIGVLLTDQGFDVGLNEPYDIKDYPGISLDINCHQRGLPTLLVEIRQDLIDTKDKAHDWARIMGEVFNAYLKNKDSRHILHEHTG